MASSPKRFLGRRTKGVLVMLGSLFFLQWLEFTGWLPLINGRIFDLILRHSSSKSGETEASKEIYIVEIDNDAYDHYFHSTSPMSPDTVFALVKAIADSSPKTIGVDIRTESGKYQAKIPSLRNLPSSIVWISAKESEDRYNAPFLPWLFGAVDRARVTPSAVLGMDPFQLPKLRQTNWGIPLFARDEDDSIRRFPRTVEISANRFQGSLLESSWARRVADVYCDPECNNESAAEVYTSYSGTPPHRLKVSELFPYSEGEKEADYFRGEGWAWEKAKHELFGKIVLIGGTFKESGDFYRTPKRELPGLVINAYAVQAELNGNGLEALNQPVAWMLDLALGLLILFICDEAVVGSLPRLRAVPFVGAWGRERESWCLVPH